MTFQKYYVASMSLDLQNVHIKKWGGMGEKIKKYEESL